ncbi:hypothetical protein [Arthrobacter sp. H14]|uniref:hypothetical protein n=1 Tax=Arthrobacter sp. H14 TaxID=1312959 RepID=UPI000479B4DD|nr:hypothetical protein [Arthrobacter sp. H14]
MESFEVSVNDELFRISERTQPGGSLSYDFAWLNGPADGTYGFTASRLVADSGDDTSGSEVSMTRAELAEEVREFVKRFYEPGGVAEDFPDHGPARARRLNDR